MDHTNRCPHCGFVAKNATGLSSHTRKHRLPDGTFPPVEQVVTPPQMDATGDFIAPAEQRRRATPEPRQQEPVTIGLRRCKGSETFGIEAHDASLADFPVQPSRKDGLGVMCKTHWREYTNALRHRAEAAKGAPAPAPSTDDAPAPRKRAQRPAQAPTVDPALAAAAALIQDVDALPADEYVKRVGQDDVQAALAMVAKGHGTEEATA